VHEYGFEYGGFDGRHFTTAYVLGANQVETLPDIETFARSEIYDALPIEIRDVGGYADAYLTGFSGTQDLASVLDEVNAYTYSLIVDMAIVDQLAAGWRRSSQDGILTFLLYLETYLFLARTQHPEDYTEILETPGIPPFILTLWDRAVYYITQAGDDPRLYIDGDTIRPYVFDPSRVAEIERLWQAP
jgi:hypothetical protein